MRLPGLLAADPRAKAGAALALGLFAWKSGWPGLALYALGLAPACLALGAFRAEHLKTFRAVLLFALFWTLAVFCLSAWDLGAGPALSRAALLGARLAVLLLAGLVLALSTPPRQLGLALCWALRPALGKRAWKTALGLALMVHFLPLAGETLRRVRLALRLRGANLSPARRALLLAQAGLRCLAGRTWDHTLALATRGLDRPEAWTPDFPPAAADLLLAGALAVLAWQASLL